MNDNIKDFEKTQIDDVEESWVEFIAAIVFAGVFVLCAVGLMHFYSR